MFTIPNNARNPVADKRKDGGNSYPCIICGITCQTPRYTVHLHGGGSTIVTEIEAARLAPGEDLGAYPIGASCLKKYPELLAGYVYDNKRGGFVIGKGIQAVQPEISQQG